MAQLTWYEHIGQHNNKLYEKATWIKARLQHVMLTFLFVYTLCYLLLMNGIYITNLTHKTSININVHQSNEQTRMVYARITDGHLQEKNDDTDDRDDAGKTGDIYDESQEEKTEVYKNKKERIRKNMFFYDHPVLHRISGRYVFYLSAITDAAQFGPSDNSNVNAMEKTNRVILDSLPDEKHDTKHADYVEELDSDYHKTDEVFKSGNIENEWEDESGRNNTAVIVLNGWESYLHVKYRYQCCYKYKNEQKLSTNLIKKITWNVNDLKIMKATQFVCPLLVHAVNDSIEMLPTQVAIALKDGCRNPKYSPKYAEVEATFPKINNVSIGICAKLIYRNFSAEKLIEWVEFNRLMGVDKIMLFTYDISPECKNVLDFYANQGLIFTKEFDYPIKMTYLRLPGGKNVMAFQDEQVTVFDCMERFNNYDFVAVLDLDEFLVPASNRNWKDMLSDLLLDFPDASGFSFHTAVFTLDWGISNPGGNFFVTKYIKRTRTMWDRKKNIILPSRILRGSTWTHEFTSLNGFQAIKVGTEHANIFHYRKCRPQWVMFGTCLTKRQKYHDVTMIKVMDRITELVLERKQKLLT